MSEPATPEPVARPSAAAHGSALSRYRAERLLRKGFSPLRSKVLTVVGSRLRAKGVSIDRADLEACYAQAWHGLYATVLAGESVESPEGWLVLVTFRRAIDEARSPSRADLGTADDIAALGNDTVLGAAALAAAALGPDIAAAMDDRARLRAVFEAMRSRLSARECEAASLCYLQGLSRAEAAAMMGVSERRMSKLMEGTGGGELGVAGKVGELLATIQAGGWCEQQSSLMRAYAFGILDPAGERHALAVAHTRECPACRAHVAALRGLASVLPPLPFALPFAHTEGRGAETRARARRASAGRGARRGMRSPRTGVGLPSAGGGWSGAGGSLAAKLVVSGVVLLGAGAAYLAARSPAPPARDQAVHAAAAPAAGGAPLTPGSFAQEAKKRTRAGAPPPARSARARRQPARRQASARHGAAHGASSAGEFSPERARDEARSGAPAPATPTPRPVLPPSSRSSPSSGSSGEFGIE